MAGNFRSGRRPYKRKIPKTAQGRPKKLRPLMQDEQWFWDNVIATSKHLAEVDSPLAQACCELWGLYQSALRMAQTSPMDKEARLTVTAYAREWANILSKLGVDPLARQRLWDKIEDKEISGPLEKFGILAS